MAAGTFNVFAESEVIGSVKFQGANDIGPHLVVEFKKVMFRPDAAIGFIQDSWGQITVTGEVLLDDDGIFGTITHPDTTQVSPLVSQYYQGKGVVSVKLEDDIDYVDAGNVPTFEFQPNITTEAHFSSRFGVRTKDLEVITEKAASLSIVMDEFTYKNLKFALLGADAVVGP